jgi:phospholipid/cholesterol/gamma-HCH transport system substrate-binding protein
MKQQAKEIWVGVFVLVGIVVLCGMVLHFGKVSERFNKMYQFHVRFENVGQIAPKAPVIMSGVHIGKVARITLDRKEGTVLLTLAVWQGIDIRKDAAFTIKQAGLLGDLHVVVVPKSNTEPIIQPGDTVDGREPTDIQDTLEQAAQVVVKIKTAADNIESATRKLDQQIMNEQTLGELRSAISNINVTSSAATRLVEETRGLVGKTTSGIDSTLANLSQFSTNLNQFSTNLNQASAKTLDIVRANEDDIRLAVQNLKGSSERLNNMLANVESGKGTIGKLLVDDSFHEELKRLVTNLRRFGVLRYKDAPLPGEEPKAAPVPAPGTSSKGGSR